MSAEVFIRGDERTRLEYLIEPLSSSMNRAARERYTQLLLV